MSELQDCLDFVNSELEANADKIREIKANLYQAKKIRLILRSEYNSVRAEMES